MPKFLKIVSVYAKNAKGKSLIVFAASFVIHFLAIATAALTLDLVLEEVEVEETTIPQTTGITTIKIKEEIRQEVVRQALHLLLSLEVQQNKESQFKIL